MVRVTSTGEAKLAWILPIRESEEFDKKIENILLESKLKDYELKLLKIYVT